MSLIEKYTKQANPGILYDTITYKGRTVDVFQDLKGQQLVILGNNNELIPLGTYNFDYKTVIKAIIDNELNLIARFPKFRGTKLEWFQNGLHRDIRLMYQRRCLKIFLVAKAEDINLDSLKDQAYKILERLVDVRDII